MEEDLQSNESKRYYPTPAEQNILTSNISRYFSYPERSPERSKVAADVSSSLQQFSPHWSHRAVRLWFNNNKNGITPNLIDLSTRQARVTFLNFPNNQKSPPQQQFNPQNQWNNPVPTQKVSIDELISIIDSSSQTNLNNLMSLANHFNERCSLMNSQGLFNSIDKHKNSTSINFSCPKDILMESNFQGNSFLLSRPPSVDDQSLLWNQRAFKDKFINSFDTSFNNNGVSCYINEITNDLEKELFYSFDFENWNSIKLGSKSRFESLYYDGNNFFFFNNLKLLKISLNSIPKVSNIILKFKESHYPPSIINFQDGILCGFSNSNELQYINSKFKIKNIHLNNFNDWGICNLNTNLNNQIFTAFSQSPTLYLFNEEGEIIRPFIGHTQTINFIQNKNENIFITSSDDKTTKIWDIRESNFIHSISCDKKSITGLNCSENYLILSLFDKKICIFDFKNLKPEPFLGIKTDDYTIENPYLNLNNNIFSFFGIATKNGLNDSVLFVDNEGNNNKYTYRTYKPFL